MSSRSRSSSPDGKVLLSSGSAFSKPFSSSIDGSRGRSAPHQLNGIHPFFPNVQSIVKNNVSQRVRIQGRDDAPVMVSTAWYQSPASSTARMS